MSEWIVRHPKRTYQEVMDNIIRDMKKAIEVQPRAYKLEEFKELVYSDYLPLLKLTMQGLHFYGYRGDWKGRIAGFFNSIYEVRNVSREDIKTSKLLDLLVESDRTMDSFLDIVHDYFNIDQD